MRTLNYVTGVCTGKQSRRFSHLAKACSVFTLLESTFFSAHELIFHVFDVVVPLHITRHREPVRDTLWRTFGR